MATNFFDLGHHGTAKTCYAEEDNKAYIWDHQSESEMQAILDYNSHARSVNTLRKTARGYIVGNIPITIYLKWERYWKKYCKDYITWEKYLIQKLNSREFSQFRTVSDTKKLETKCG